jgi:hypothetical protein
MIAPVNYISVVQKFGNHKGVDLGWFSKEHHNQDILAIDDGVVIYNRKQVTGGYVIHIRHDNGFVSEYGHLLKDSQKVHEGDKVKKGQVIAKMGASGMVTGEHLHFGLYQGDSINYKDKSNFVNPLEYINVYDHQVINDKSKNLIKHTMHVSKLPDPPLNVRQTNLWGKIVYTVNEGEEIENYGTSGNCHIVDNSRGYVCSKKYVK